MRQEDWTYKLCAFINASTHSGEMNQNIDLHQIYIFILIHLFVQFVDIPNYNSLLDLESSKKSKQKKCAFYIRIWLVCTELYTRLFTNH